MIADTSNTGLSLNNIKKFITPDLRQLRALFFFFIFFPAARPAFSQAYNVDSLILWVNAHPQNDSAKIHMMHRISYLLSETDVNKSFEYYKKVSSLSDSLNFTFGKALASTNLGILLSSAGNFESSTKAFFQAIDLAKSCGARRVEAVALNNIGENFASLRDFDKCRKYALQAIEINHSIKAWRGVALNYELLNRCDLEQGLYANAQMNLDSGMPYATADKRKLCTIAVLPGIWKTPCHSITEYDSASYYFKKAIHDCQWKPAISGMNSRRIWPKPDT